MEGSGRSVGGVAPIRVLIVQDKKDEINRQAVKASLPCSKIAANVDFGARLAHWFGVCATAPIG